jgi:N-methylhydantoinase A
MTRILCPRAAGVLAALGLVVSDRRRDVQRSVLLSGDALSGDAVREQVAALGGGDRVVAELRYRGQAFELAVPAAQDATPAQLRAAFEAAHEDRYGYRDAEQEVELVTIRVSATTPAPAFAHALVDDAALPAGTEILGPAVRPLPESTLLVPAGWRGTVLPDGAIDLRRVA